EHYHISHYGVLYTDLKGSLFMFNIFVLFKKLLVGILVGLFQVNPRDQIIGLIILTLTYIMILFIIKPYLSPMKNFAEIGIAVVQVYDYQKKKFTKLDNNFSNPIIYFHD